MDLSPKDYTHPPKRLEDGAFTAPDCSDLHLLCGYDRFNAHNLM